MSDAGSQTQVHLSLFGDALDLDAVTKWLGIEPTRTWRKGSLTNTGRPRVKDCWTFRVPLGSDAGADQQIEWIFGRVPPHRFASIPDCGVAAIQIEVVIKMSSAMAGFWLSPAVMRAIASAGMSLDVDLYSLGTSAVDVPDAT